MRAEARDKKKRLSYIEAREFESIEERVAAAEVVLDAKRQALEDPAVVSDGRKVQDAMKALDEAQAAVDALYQRWAELDAKQA